MGMYTKGPLVSYGPTRGEGLTFTNEAHVGPGKGNDICGPIAVASGDDKEQALANANLIADAFNVTTETGLTPRELAGQRNDLLAILEAVEIDVRQRAMPDLEEIRAAIAKAKGQQP